MDLLVDGHKREKEEERENPRAEKKHGTVKYMCNWGPRRRRENLGAEEIFEEIMIKMPIES